VFVIYRSYRLYLSKLENEKNHVSEMAALHMRTIEALALAIEAKDQTTHDHLERVRVYAVGNGQEARSSARGSRSVTRCGIAATTSAAGRA